MWEEVYGIEPYDERERNAGCGDTRYNQYVTFEEDMYSLLFISVVKPVYKKYCEEHQYNDKLKEVFKMTLGDKADEKESYEAPVLAINEEDFEENEEYKELKSKQVNKNEAVETEKEK